MYGRFGVRSRVGRVGRTGTEFFGSGEPNVTAISDKNNTKIPKMFLIFAQN